LSLQPLIENAIKHGVAPRADGGKIVIVATMNNADLIVTVDDNGGGAQRQAVEESQGLGLRLIAKTLSTQYEGRAEFSIETSPQQGFRVRMRIPQEEQEKFPLAVAG